LNYEKGYWYDTPLPRSGQGFSAGVYEQIFHYPIVASPGLNDDTSGSSVWQHDFGLDEISGQVATHKAVRSYYQTNEMNIVQPQQIGQLGQNQSMSISLIEPDFNQKKDLQVFVISRANARANRRMRGPLVIPEVPHGNEQTSKLKVSGRLNSFLVLSNDMGGYYEAGVPMFHWQPGDGRTEDGGDQLTDVTPDPLVFDDQLPQSGIQPRGVHLPPHLLHGKQKVPS